MASCEGCDGAAALLRLFWWFLRQPRLGATSDLVGESVMQCLDDLTQELTMTEIQHQPATLPWVQFRENMLTARETQRKAAIDAVRRFVDVHPVVSRLPRFKAVIDARLQLREDLVSARFQFHRAVLRNVNQLVSGA
jgi:hypothetical protein